MRKFSRIFFIVLALALLVGSTVVMLMTLNSAPLQNLGILPWVGDRLAGYALVDGASKTETLTFAAGFFLLGLVLLVLELQAIAPRRQALSVSRDRLGRVTVDSAVLRDLANDEARRVFGVLGCSLKVHRGRSGLVFEGRLSVEPTSSIAAVTREVQERVRTEVERSIGQPVKEIRLRCSLRVANQQPSGALLGATAGRLSPTAIIEHVGPPMAAAAALAPVVLGVLIVLHPNLLAPLAGIALVLAGVAAFLSLVTLWVEEARLSASRPPVLGERYLR